MASHRNTKITVLTLCAILGATSMAHAGFDWVPGKEQSAPAYTPAPAQNTTPQYSVTVPNTAEQDAADTLFTPMPPMVSSQQPAARAQPFMQDATISQPSNAQARNAQIRRQSLVPNEQPDSGVIESYAAKPQYAAAGNNLVKPPMPSDRNNMRIIMPDDAPANALNNTNSMVLSRYPDASQLSNTRDVAMPSADDQGEIIVPEGLTTGRLSLRSAQYAQNNVQAQKPAMQQLQPTRRINGVLVENVQAPNRAYTSPAAQPQPSPAAQNASPTIKADIAVGFAQDVPLALALRQVAPPEYAFSFASGVNPGSRVSWDGGKPWNEVISDMLIPLGYGVIVQNNKIIITPQKQAAISKPTSYSYNARMSQNAPSPFPAIGFDPVNVEPAAGGNEDLTAPSSINTIMKSQNNTTMKHATQDRHVQRLNE